MSLADAILRAARGATVELGVDLVELAGWRTRTNRSGATAAAGVRAVMWHDTVTGANVSRARLGELLRDGYVGLPGPIANAGLDRDGTLILVSVPAASHAGTGGPVLDVPAGGGNAGTYGLEAANRGAGSGERWTGPQYDVAVAFSARLADELGRGRSRFVVGHREYAPSRKVDPWAPNLAEARRHVVAYRPSGPPAPATAADLERFLVSLNARQRSTLEVLADLDEVELAAVVSFARTVKRRGSTGQGVVNAAIDDHRQRVEVGFDGAGYQAVADLVATVAEFGSGVRGLASGAIASLRQLRGLGVIDRTPARFLANRVYTVDEAAPRT